MTGREAEEVLDFSRIRQCVMEEIILWGSTLRLPKPTALQRALPVLVIIP